MEKLCSRDVSIQSLSLSKYMKLVVAEVDVLGKEPNEEGLCAEEEEDSEVSSTETALEAPQVFPEQVLVTRKGSKMADDDSSPDPRALVKDAVESDLWGE